MIRDLRVIITATIISIATMFVVGCQDTSDFTTVIKVIDGDTIVIEGGNYVRYIGIDSPEKNETYYTEAIQVNKKMVEGKRVRLQKDISDKDKYGRMLRYVYIDDVLINAEMVRLGYARAEAYPPDTNYQVYLEAMEQEAIRTKVGLWN